MKEIDINGTNVVLNGVYNVNILILENNIFKPYFLQLATLLIECSRACAHSVKHKLFLKSV